MCISGLGRDEDGALAVNLLPAIKPQDVYSKVLEVVLEQIRKDVNIDVDHSDEKIRKDGEFARMVKDLVNRKVIKQTIMTSVYGVTLVGARDQV